MVVSLANSAWLQESTQCNGTMTTVIQPTQCLFVKLLLNAAVKKFERKTFVKIIIRQEVFVDWLWYQPATPVFLITSYLIGIYIQTLWLWGISAWHNSSFVWATSGYPSKCCKSSKFCMTWGFDSKQWDNDFLDSVHPVSVCYCYC